MQPIQNMESEVLGGAKAWFSWVLGVSFVVVVFALQTGYAVTNVYVAESIGLSLVQVGIVGSVYTWVFAISQFASGSVLDTFGSRALPIACLLVALGAFGFANAPNIQILLLSQVLIAIGASFGFIGAGFVGGMWFQPIKYGFMFALVQFVASGAAVVTQQSFSQLIEGIHWSTLINALALISLGIAIILFFFLRDPKQVRTVRSQEKTWHGLKEFFANIVHNINEVAAIKDSWINCLIGAATFGTMLALGVIWGPRLLMTMGLSQSEANIATSMSWLGLAIGSPLFAFLSDKLRSRKKPMFAACLLQILTIAILLSVSTFEFRTSMLLFFIWGLAAGGSMIPFSIAADLVKPTLIGTSAALVNATQFIVAGILMAIPGQVLSGAGVVARMAVDVSGTSTAAFESYRLALLIYPLALLLALGLFLFLNETYPQSEASKG